MKKLMLFITILLLTSCYENPTQNPGYYYFNKHGIIVDIKYRTLQPHEYMGGSGYDLKSTNVYYIQLMDTSIGCQINRYNSYFFSESNLDSKKIGDTVYFEYIHKNRFYTLK